MTVGLFFSVTKRAAGMERQTGRSVAVAEFGREGVLGQASLLADGSCPLAESLARGPGGF
jgi:hypothetical protein